MRVQTLAALLISVALAVTATHSTARAKSQASSAPSPPTSGWGMIGPDRRYVPLSKRIALYQQLGLGWVRVGTLVPPGAPAMTGIDDIAALRASGLKIFLTVSGLRFRIPGAIQPDYDSFAANLKWVIEGYHPDMVVVENEVDNAPFTEPAQDYLKEVQTVCGLAHAERIQCTDGGLTTKMMISMVVKEYLAHGDVAHANYYGRYLRLWYPMHFQLNPTGSALSQMIESVGAGRASDILHGLRAAGADRVNLHWYVRPAGGISSQEQQDLLIQVVHMLHTVTGLPVAGGEVGLDKPHADDVNIDPAPFVAAMSTMASLGVSPLIVWNPGSGLFGANQNGRSLVDSQGNLLTVGRAYAQLIHSRPYPDGMSKTSK